ncbi:DUF922 domain-containing Zn-dependent protease [Ahniella affigens]|nr:DUF922 domain-containing protein [Ahniella affigens]
MRFRLILAALPLLGSATLALAEVNEELDETYYEVEHEEGDSLSEAITAASPIEGGYHGYTEWHVKWRYTWSYDSESCWITDVTVDFSATLTLPELYTDDPRAERRFDRYMTALREHEEGHVDNGRQAAEEVEEGILNMDARPNCKALERDANALGLMIVKRGNRRDKEYDRATDHGRTQGARVND